MLKKVKGRCAWCMGKLELWQSKWKTCEKCEKEYDRWRRAEYRKRIRNASEGQLEGK